MGPARMFLSTTAPSGRPATTEPHTPTPPVLPQLSRLQRQIQTLKAENDDLRAVKTAQVATIDELRVELPAKDYEHARLVEQMGAEAAALKEEKWNLLGRVAELEQLQQAVDSEPEPSIYAASVRSGAPPPPSHRGIEAERDGVAGYNTPWSLYNGCGNGEDDGGRRHHSERSSAVTASARSFVRRRPKRR